MKTRTVLGALALATMPLFLATPAQAVGGLDILSGLLKDGPEKEIPLADGGPVGSGLSALVAIAEGILR
ncbi:hypothetical protein AB0G64_31230 [Streptomyces longwoodensis]|uniref:hypothetical protein n=1 Tax=Streptomyces longwoodensis TaxID=68231 RepID=UPI0033F031C9